VRNEDLSRRRRQGVQGEWRTMNLRAGDARGVRNDDLAAHREGAPGGRGLGRSPDERQPVPSP
jgi:hypothetical protein